MRPSLFWSSHGRNTFKSTVQTLSRVHPLSRPARRHATTISKPRNRLRPIALGLSSALILGAGAVAVSDDARHTFQATRRAGRVAVALAVCINDYRVTLNAKDDTETYARLLRECHQRCADRTFAVMATNGSIFIKLGQHLTSLTYLLPKEWCDTFIPLQDRCPVSTFDSVERLIVQDSGRPLLDIFDTFEHEPIAAASLAQVHLATLKGTGERVAVKVQHPDLEEWVALDLSLTRFTFRMLKRYFPEYDLTWLSEEMEVSLPTELDFRLEGQNATEAKEYFGHVRNIPLIVPAVKSAQRRFLVMEYVPGHRLDDFAYLDENDLDRDEISAALSRMMNEMIFGTNAPLHCDTHMGNIAIKVNESRAWPHNFDIILYDHGLYRHPPASVRQAYAKLWLAILDADESRMRTHAKELAGITDEQFPLFASAITGRDYSVVASGVAAPRSERENEAISEALGDGLIEQLIQILAHVPRIILLILKTNDLTRSLDASLQTREGPVRTFLILARYAARAVYEEHVRALGDRLWTSPKALWSYAVAWTAYERVHLKLNVYEYYLYLRRLFGLRTQS